MSILCKILNWILKIFGQVVDFVASAVSTIGTAFVDVLSTLANAVGDAIFGGGTGSLVLLLGLGAAAWFVFGGSDDDDNSVRQAQAEIRSAANQGVTDNVTTS